MRKQSVVLFNNNGVPSDVTVVDDVTV